MAFLFKSKKHADKTQGSKDGLNGVAGSQSSLVSSNRQMNEKQTTPGSSVNNSLNSLHGGGTQTPSPELLNGRRGPSVDQPAQGDLPVRYNNVGSFCTIPLDVFHCKY